MMKHRRANCLLLAALILVSAETASIRPTTAQDSSKPHHGPVSAQELSAQEATTATKRAKKPGSQYAVKAAVLNHPRLVLKHGSRFLVMDEAGLMPEGTACGYGLYMDDTRYLSGWNFKVNGAEPVLLSDSTYDGYAGRFLYQNRGNTSSGAAHEQILLDRRVVITDGAYEKLSLTNYGLEKTSAVLDMQFASDFADMFEVRGSKRTRRGTLETVEVDRDNSTVTFSYTGLDGKRMQTALQFQGCKPHLEPSSATVTFDLAPKETKTVYVAIVPTFDPETIKKRTTTFDWEAEKKRADEAYAKWSAEGLEIKTGNSELNRLIDRSDHDLYILRQSTPKGNCLAAGVPWFAVAFGRDEEITALECLPFHPDLAKDVLSVLAAYQGEKVDDYTEEKPGKIMHELRLGEMARTREIPFVPYYGAADTTPLWLMLLGRYIDQTGDLDFARAHWLVIERALDYIDRECPEDGYLAYGAKPGGALSNQGWKDSGDSIMYADGKLAKRPIALSEVQGYLYEAWTRTAKLARALQHNEIAERLEDKAKRLKQRFNKDFWMPEKGYVALALDGDGKQCDVVSSNPSHLLSTGLLEPEAAAKVASKLASDEMFSGWPPGVCGGSILRPSPSLPGSSTVNQQPNRGSFSHRPRISACTPIGRSH